MSKRKVAVKPLGPFEIEEFNQQAVAYVRRLRSLDFSEADSGLWVGYWSELKLPEKGFCQIGAVLKVCPDSCWWERSSCLGEGMVRYDALTCWRQIEPGELLGSFDCWQSACNCVRDWVRQGSPPAGRLPEYHPDYKVEDYLVTAVRCASGLLNLIER